MLELLNSLDTALFLFLNTAFSNPVFDFFFTFITDTHNWILPLLVLAFLSVVGIGRGERLPLALRPRPLLEPPGWSRPQARGLAPSAFFVRTAFHLKWNPHVQTEFSPRG